MLLIELSQEPHGVISCAKYSFGAVQFHVPFVAPLPSQTAFGTGHITGEATDWLKPTFDVMVPLRFRTCPNVY
jgi:hypothetical protein